MEYVVRDANSDEIPKIADLILLHGTVPENCISEEWVKEHLEGINDGSVGALVAELRGEIIGVVTHERSNRFADLQPSGEPEHGYVNEIVVHTDYRGKGIGPRLFSDAAEQRLRQDGAVYSMHHEKNHASARMMDKSGFEPVEIYEDEDRPRIDGSQKTVVRRKTRATKTD